MVMMLHPCHCYFLVLNTILFLSYVQLSQLSSMSVGSHSDTPFYMPTDVQRDHSAITAYDTTTASSKMFAV
jgi:hypothetical protein